MDSDSMPMHLESYSDMVNYTAFRPLQIYTPEMLKDIVKYAKVRGIKVIPELEAPAKVNFLGHYPPLKSLIYCYKDKSDKKEQELLDSVRSKATVMYWYNNDRMDYRKEDILQYKDSSRQIKTEMITDKNNYFVLIPKDIMIVECGYPDYTGGRSRCGGTKSWKIYYNFNPDNYNST